MEKNLTAESKRIVSPEILFRQNRNDTDCRMTNPLNLAFIGDAVYSYYIRRYLIAKTDMNVDHLTKASVNFVKAEAQAYAIHHMDNMLTDTEKTYVRRGRNTKSIPPNHADKMDYRYATGFEALLGYLSLTGQNDRLEFLIAKAISLCEERTAV